MSFCPLALAWDRNYGSISFVHGYKSWGELSMLSKVGYPVQFVLSAGRDCPAVNVLAANARDDKINLKLLYFNDYQGFSTSELAPWLVKAHYARQLHEATRE